MKNDKTRDTCVIFERWPPLVDGTSSDETITSYRTKERFYTITRQIILALPLKKKKRKLIFPLNSSKLFEQQLKLHFDTDIIITTIQVTIK